MDGFWIAITSLGNDLFNGFGNLKTIELHDSIVEIGESIVEMTKNKEIRLQNLVKNAKMHISEQNGK